MSEIRLIDYGAVMWSFYEPDYIGIDNICKWIEFFVAIGITHETIHHIIKKLEGYETTKKFDNLFGFIDRSITLCPETDYVYEKIQRERIEKLWRT